MKKFWLFAISTFVAFAIAIYSKRLPSTYTYNKGKAAWKTFEKNSNKEITAHQATDSELSKAHIATPKRAIAQAGEQDKSDSDDQRYSFDKQWESARGNNFLMRENRVLIGDVQKRNYEDEDVELPMTNKPNPNWKDILGNELLRFQATDTKVMVKEEFPVIKIQNSEGQYLEQVIITYVSKNGDQNSFRALVNSETGLVVETWDRSIQEKVKPERADLGSLPFEKHSGIITR